MEITIGKTAGFCFGIANAVTKAEKECEENGETYCLGDLAHNHQTMEEIKKKGLKVINDIDELPVRTY